MYIQHISDRLSITTLQFQQTISYYSSFIIIAAAGASIGPLLPWLAQQTGVTLSVISAVFLVRPFGTMLGAWTGGRLFDRLPAHRLALSAILLLGLATAIVPLISSFYLLLVILFVSGFFASAINVGGNLLILRVHVIRTAPFVNGLHFVFSAGALLGPILLAESVKWSGKIDAGLWGLAILALIPATLLSRTPAPHWQQKTAATDNGRRIDPLILMMVVFYFLLVGTDISFGGWIYTYGLETGIGDKVSAAYLTSLYWIAQATGRFLAIPFSSRFSPIRLIITGLGLAMITVLTMLTAPMSSLIMWPATFMLGFSLGPLFASMLAFAREKLEITGKTTGRFFIGASLGAMTIPWIIGQFFEQTGPQMLLYTAGVNVFLEFAVVLTIRSLAMSRSASSSDLH